MFETLKSDIAAYQGIGHWYRRSGFWIVAIYRFGCWADSLSSPLLRIPFWGSYLILKVLQTLLVPSVVLWAGRRGSKIGKGLCLFHAQNVMIGRGTEIGDNCQIYHEVTLGTGQVLGTPKIGNRVTIYPGARVLGGIEIGDRSIVGANCVVTRNIPPASIILSAPSKIVPRSLSTHARRWDKKSESVVSTPDGQAEEAEPSLD